MIERLEAALAMLADCKVNFSLPKSGVETKSCILDLHLTLSAIEGEIMLEERRRELGESNDILEGGVFW
jgi:hypothetical protein